MLRLNNPPQDRRLLEVRFERNPDADAAKGDIQYSGFRFTWPDGTPAKTGLDKFCQRGVKLFFGKAGLTGDSALLQLYCVPVLEDTPFTQTPPGVRGRRFFLLRQGHKGVIHFLNGTPTDVIFDERLEEPAVLEWIGLTPDLGDGQRQWMDIYAVAVPEKKPSWIAGRLKNLFNFVRRRKAG